jgi:hypothetical protein
MSFYDCLYMHSSDLAIATTHMLHTKLLGCIGWHEACQHDRELCSRKIVVCCSVNAAKVCGPASHLDCLLCQLYIYTYMFARVRIKHTCIHMYVSAFGWQPLWDTFEISQMLVINLAIIYSLAVA